MGRRYFGTDGIRGTVGQEPITPDFMLRLGHAVGRVLKQSAARPSVVIGKDTRISGYMIESALEAGFASAGVDTLLSGPLPTPGVAYLTRALRLNLGVVISASHNPFGDNGIKFFSANGHKLPDAWELAVEGMLLEPPQWADSAGMYPTPAPLTMEEASCYIDINLFPLLRVMMLSDNEGWSLFADPERRAQQRRDTLAAFDKVEMLIS